MIEKAIRYPTKSRINHLEPEKVAPPKDNRMCLSLFRQD